MVDKNFAEIDSRKVCHFFIQSILSLANQSSIFVALLSLFFYIYLCGSHLTHIWTHQTDYTPFMLKVFRYKCKFVYTFTRRIHRRDIKCATDNSNNTLSHSS